MIGAVQVIAALAGCASQAGVQAPAASSTAPVTEHFWSSFEAGDPEPAVDRIERAEGMAMALRRADGPDAAYTARTQVGFTGVHSLEYAGEVTGGDGGHAYHALFDVNISVTAATELSYRVFPRFMDGDPGSGPGQSLRYSSTFVAVDLIFSDGTRLSDLGARDQHGFTLSPRGQGESKSLYTNQWNHKQSRIGDVAAGKVIEQILIGVDAPFGRGAFRGWLDDIRLVDGITADLPAASTKRPSDHVLTTRGTNSSGAFSRGNTIPATAMPHGFNFWAPVTDASSLSWFYEYAKRNDEQNLPRLEALTLTHETSPWMGDRQTFQVMPSLASGVPGANRDDRAVPFRHENEIARPHYYRVRLDNGIVAEIAPTDHAAMFRFTFPGDDASLIFDNVNDQGGLSLSPDIAAFTGYTDTRSGLSNGASRMFIYATFDRPVTASGKLVATDGPEGSGPRVDVPGYYRFDAGDDRTVTMRIATSLISVEQARHNLALQIAETDTFEDIRARAQQAWDERLGVIEVEGASPDQLTTLYSNLYRLFLYPNAGHENGGSNAAPVWRHAVQSSASKDIPEGTTETRTGAPVVDGKVYVNNGFWDTYRTTWAAYSLFVPSQAAEMVNGFVQHYHDGGWVPRWSSPGYANLMTGTSSDVSFADAYVKGVEGIDAANTYKAMIRNAAVAPPNDNIGRKGMDVAPFIGYTPSSVGEGVSWALEGYINDYGIANMLAVMAQDPAAPVPQDRLQAEHAYYRNRARNYVHMFDPAIGFFQGRSTDGEWKSSPGNYDPEVWGHDHDYTETNGWGFAFLVPHDGQGLANLYGGRDGLARKLDEYFATPETAGFPGSYGGVIHEMVEARDVRMGQWGFSNQVAHHVPWMYLYTGRPWRTQEIVRETLARMYVGSEIGQGYPGDEDNGESSAWWLFAALGFYPLQMGSEHLVVGSPLFTKATVHLENGRELVIAAPDNSPDNLYVAGVKVDGEAWDSTYLPHRLLAEGGHIEFQMSSAPAAWGSGASALPPSLTTGDAPPVPLADLTGPGRGSASTSVSAVNAGGLFDNTSRTQAVFPGTAPVSVTYAFDATPSADVTFYTLTSGSTGGHPTGWVLQGSDDGSTWEELDRRTGEAFEWARYTRPFRLDTPVRYSGYRLVITDASDPRQFSLAEIELLGVPVVHRSRPVE